MKKKIVCFVLCAGLAVTYSGCGSAAGDTDMQGKVMEDSRESTKKMKMNKWWERVSNRMKS